MLSCPPPATPSRAHLKQCSSSAGLPLTYSSAVTSSTRQQKRSLLSSKMSDSDSDTDVTVELPSKIINGSHIAAQIRLEVADAVKVLAAESSLSGEPVVPGLAVVLGE